MKTKIIGLAVASLFISNAALAADKSWTGFKVGVGVGGLNAQSKDKTTSSHSFSDNGSFTTPNDIASDDANYDNVGANAHANLRNAINSVNPLNVPSLDASAGVADSSASTSAAGTFNAAPGGYASGTNIYNRNYSFSELFSGNGFSSNDLSKSNMFGTIEAGYDWQLTDRVVFGLNASFNLSSKNKSKGTGSGSNTSSWTETYSYDSRTYSDNAVVGGGGGSPADTWTVTQNPNVPNAYAPGNTGYQSSNISVNSSVETGNSFDLGGRLGFLATDDTLIFMSGGASAINAKQNLTYSSSANLDGTSAFGDSGNSNSYNFSRSSSKSDTRFGYYVGAGIEARVTANASLKLEYRYADYGKMRSSLARNETLSDTGDNNLEFYDSIDGSSSLKQESDITAHSFRAVLNYNF